MTDSDFDSSSVFNIKVDPKPEIPLTAWGDICKKKVVSSELFSFRLQEVLFENFHPVLCSSSGRGVRFLVDC